VDLWDLTKLLFRRWYVTLPMLLISLTGVLLVSQTVKPDYSAVGHLQLLPAAGTTTAADPKAVIIKNPWDDLGFQQLGLAVIVKMQDPEIAKSLKASGLAESYSVTIEYGTTFFLITATGSSAAQATATVQQVMKLVAQDVAAEQQRFNVATENAIRTLELDKGESVTEITSKFKRVVLVSGGIGFLLTTGITIGVDAWLRRRERRQSGAAQREAAALDLIPTGAVVRRGGAVESISPGVAISSSPTLSKQVGEQPVGQYGSPAVRASVSAPASNIEYQSHAGDTEVESPPTEAFESAPDSTIVLPLQLSRSNNGGPENRRR
jgi:hypothetical protein